MSKLILGLDPDIGNIGAGIYNKETKELKYLGIQFFDLHRWLIENKDEIIEVKIEASWLISKSNFHSSIPKKKGFSYGEVLKYSNISAKIGKSVGSNHEVGRKIKEMLEDLQIPYKLSKPLLKKWKGPNGKITHDEIVKLLKPLGIEMGKKSNQDQRDSILICLF